MTTKNTHRLLKGLENLPNKREPRLALLIDPDKFEAMNPLLTHTLLDCFEYIFVGGSLMTQNKLDECIAHIRSYTQKPIMLFPGSILQISDMADGLLYLSLISGRNPDLLIGRHVESAIRLKESKLEVLPTGYILIDGGIPTTVSYISNTTPIPADKPELAAVTALAGSMLGLRLIYLDAGSGAVTPVSTRTISAVSNMVELPIIVGGGIRNLDQIKSNFFAGAHLQVMGNIFEKSTTLGLELLMQFSEWKMTQKVSVSS